MRDAHAGVFPAGANPEYRPYENNLRQRYYYTGLYFAKDNNNTFTTQIDGESWQFVSFSDERVRMKTTLLPDGRVCYSPVLMSSSVEVTDSELVLENNGKQQSLPLAWTASRSYYDFYSGDPDYKLLQQNGVFYISERAFRAYDPSILEQFASDGAQARRAKLIVFDLRSNGGSELTIRSGDNWAVFRWYGGEE